MSRKRYISTDMSKSGKLEELARRVGDYGVLLFTWMIPHFDDWGRMEGDPDKVFFEVTPRFAMLGKTPQDAETALGAMHDIGLITWYEVDGKRYIQANLDTFYELQTYIPKAKRAEDKSHYPPPPGNRGAQNSTGSHGVAQSSTAVREVAQNTPSPFTLPPYYPTQTDRLTVDASVNENASADESVSQSVSPSPVTNDLPEPSDDMDWPDVTARYHRRLGVLGPLILARLEHWREQGLSPGAIVTAIDRTAAARDEKRIRGHPDHYLDGVLRGMYNDGIRTVEDIRKRDGPQTEEDAVAAILERASQAGSSAADIQAILRRAGEVN